MTHAAPFPLPPAPVSSLPRAEAAGEPDRRGTPMLAIDHPVRWSPTSISTQARLPLLRPRRMRDSSRSVTPIRMNNAPTPRPDQRFHSLRALFSGRSRPIWQYLGTRRGLMRIGQRGIGFQSVAAEHRQRRLIPTARDTSQLQSRPSKALGPITGNDAPRRCVPLCRLRRWASRSSARTSADASTGTGLARALSSFDSSASSSSADRALVPCPPINAPSVGVGDYEPDNDADRDFQIRPNTFRLPLRGERGPTSARSPRKDAIRNIAASYKGLHNHARSFGRLRLLRQIARATISGPHLRI